MLHSVWAVFIFWIVTAIIFGVIAGIILQHKGGNDLDAMLSGFLAVIMSAVLVIVYLVIVNKIRDNAETVDYISDTQKIYCLNDNSEVSGRLYLYSGYIKEDMVYRMYVDYGEGKKLKEVKSDYSCIIEDNNTEIVTYKTKYKSDAITWWFGENDNHETYEIHIPKGSITNDYKIDNK